MADKLHQDLADLARNLSLVTGLELVVMSAGRLELIKSALKPLANFAPSKNGGTSGLPDNFVVTQGSAMAKRQITVGDCRQAAHVLQLLDPAEATVIDVEVARG